MQDFFTKWVIYDKNKDEYYLKANNSPVTYERKGSAKSAVERLIKLHNGLITHAEVRDIPREVFHWVEPWRLLTEDDFEIRQCTVTYTIT